MFSDKFIDSIPEDLAHGAIYIAEAFFEFNVEHEQKSLDHHDDYMEFYSLFEAFLSSKNDSFKPVNIGGYLKGNIDEIRKFFFFKNSHFKEILTKEKANNSKERYSRIFNHAFMYEFTEGDLKRIQTLINELREQIANSELFDAKHQARILKRLEKLQSELHKKVSDVDRFWGLVGDAGVALGKFGNDAKPIVDRIKEITQIVWNTQARSEELPSGTSVPKFIREENSEEN
ncbi:MAG: hypothetical protein V4604_02435 [Bacteroidota bacterium]